MNSNRRLALGVIGTIVALPVTACVSTMDEATEPPTEPVTEYVDPLSQEMWEVDTATDEPVTEPIAADVADALDDAVPEWDVEQTGPTEWTVTEQAKADALDEGGDTDTEAEAQETEPEATEPEVIHEDDPRWDCRTMGNRTCGVLIHDTWYVVTFDADGQPLAVATR